MPMWVRALAVSVVLASVLALAVPARAGALDARGVVILCYESADGVDTRRCSLEPELRKVLRAEGAVIVDQAQAERLKAQYTPERFAAGKDLKGIDLLDADLGIIARIDVVKDAAVGKVGRYRQSVTLDVLDTSRAQILTSTTFEAQVNGTSASDALAYLARAFARDKSAEFRGELVAAVNAPQGVELWVYGLPDGVQSVQQVEAAITSSGMTTAVRKVGFDAAVAKWRLVLARGASPDALAAHVEKQGPLLAVQGVAGGLVQLAYRPDRHLKLTCGVDVKAHPGAPGWLGQSLEGLVRHSLLGIGWMTPVAAQDGTTRLVVTSQGAGKGRVAFVFKLVRSDGMQIATTRETGRLDEAPALVARGVEGLLGGVKRWLSANPSQLPDFRRALEAPEFLEVSVQAGPEGVIDGASLAAGHALGAVTFSPPLDDARVRASVVGVTEGTWRPAKGQEGDLVVEDVGKLLSLTSPTPILVEIEVEGRVGDRMVRERTGEALLYRPVNTVDTERLPTFARVVQPSPAWAPRLITPALADAPTVPSSTLGRAARVWDRIVGQGLVVDTTATATSGDRWAVVQTPAATLSTGRGDARALLALVATAFEAAGIETRLVRTPTAWLVAVDTMLPAGAWPLVSSSPKGVVVEAGRLFAPLDPTALDADLWTAVARGSAEVERQAARLEVASPRAAWAEHKSVPDGAVAAAVDDRATVKEPVRVLVVDVRGDKLSVDERSLLGQRLTQSLAAVPGLRVLSSADLRAMLDVEAQRQAAGCDEASCLADIAGAVGARFFVAAQASMVGDGLLLAVTLTDTKNVEVVERVEVQAPNATTAAARVGGAGARVAGAALGRSGVVASGPWAFEAHLARLRDKLPADPLARARFLAMAGDLEAAAVEAARVKAPVRRKAIEANLETLRRDPAARAVMLAW